MQDRCQSADKQAGSDEQADVLRRHSSCRTNDQGWGDDASVHREDMLEPVGEGRAQRQSLVFGADGRNAGFFLGVHGRLPWFMADAFVWLTMSG
ncbi:hypothetical protein D9M69_708580 [compost metagenome]